MFMKRRGFIYLLLIISTVLIATPGCKKKPKETTPIPGAATGRTGVDVPPPISDGPNISREPRVFTEPNVNSGENFNNGGIRQPGRDAFEGPKDRDIFKANTVYFDFDRATIRAAERPNLEAVANHLKAQPATALMIEGHCDERGTEGYNLALGDRRALAAREFLINSGISAERIQTISFGEARPAVNEQNDAAYAKNRRAEFVLVLPAQ